ncbi:MAG: c-type cytochrome [Geminicoccaceae bacterium]
MHNVLLAGMMGLAAPVAVAGAAQDAPPALDPEHVGTGRAIYREYCASCHGLEGEGASDWQEPDEQGELPAPPHGPQGHTWRHADAALYRMVSQGWRDPFNKTKRLTMPGFEDVLSSEEIRAVITYLKTLWTPEQRRFQREESRDRPFPSDAREPVSVSPPRSD